MVEYKLICPAHLQFIIEGLITIFCTLLTLFFLPDYPSSAKFLTEDDKKFIEARIKVKGGGYTNEHATRREVMETLFSPRMLAHYLAYICNCVPLGSLTFFTPTIVNGLGFSSIRAQLMTGKWCIVGCLCFFNCANTSISTTMGMWLLRLPVPRLECRPLQCSRLARYCQLHDRRHRLAYSWLAARRRIHCSLRLPLSLCLRRVPKLWPVECVGDL
jgi:hypothetical protein